MHKEIRQNSSAPLVRRVLELWPYLFIATSVVGLAYTALRSARWGRAPPTEYQSSTQTRGWNSGDPTWSNL